MQELDLSRHGVRRALHLWRAAVEQGGLQMEDGLLLFGVDFGAEEDEAVRIAQAGLERRRAAAHHDLLARVLDDLEVVREPQALLELVDGQVGRAPEVVVSARRLVIALLQHALCLET